MKTFLAALVVVLAAGSHNQELDHNARRELERRYGPESIGAPPLEVTSFKPGPGTLQVPYKAVDSYGRVADLSSY